MATGSSKTARPALGTGHLWWTVEQHLLDAMTVFCVGRAASPREGHFEIDVARIADDAQFDGLHVLRTNSTMNMLSVALPYSQGAAPSTTPRAPAVWCHVALKFPIRVLFHVVGKSHCPT